MRARERAEQVLAWFRQERPVVKTELHYRSPYELLVAVMLSAQCTDKRINLVTPALFEKYPDARTLAQADAADILPYISSVTYPNSKATHLAAMARMLHQEYDGVVPEDPKELVKLPGVGRKTANVVLSAIYDQPRIAVDTHVYRVSRRIGLVPLTANTPLKVEEKLMRVIPEEYLQNAHHWILLHGRYICTARKPKCDTCGISDYCKYHERQLKKTATTPASAASKSDPHTH